MDCPLLASRRDAEFKTTPRNTREIITRVASHSFTSGFASIGKLPAHFGWYIQYGIGIKLGLTNAETT